jgi:hypothetical protein
VGLSIADEFVAVYQSWKSVSSVGEVGFGSSTMGVLMLDISKYPPPPLWLLSPIVLAPTVLGFVGL